MKFQEQYFQKIFWLQIFTPDESTVSVFVKRENIPKIPIYTIEKFHYHVMLALDNFLSSSSIYMFLKKRKTLPQISNIQLNKTSIISDQRYLKIHCIFYIF